MIEDIISDGNKEFLIPELPEGFKIMFAGNLGESQDLENILNAFLELKYNKNIKLIILGDGRKASFINEFIKRKQSKRYSIYSWKISFKCNG